MTKESQLIGGNYTVKSRRRSLKDVECYHCHKKGHVKKNCHVWKKEKGKEKKHEGGKEIVPSGVKIEEMNAAVSKDSDDGDTCLT